MTYLTFNFYQYLKNLTTVFVQYFHLVALSIWEHRTFLAYYLTHHLILWFEGNWTWVQSQYCKETLLLCFCKVMIEVFHLVLETGGAV